VTAPEDETRQAHLASLVDPDGGRILDRVVLDDVYDGSIVALAHPGDGRCCSNRARVRTEATCFSPGRRRRRSTSI
jgi:hypothetical protein